MVLETREKILQCASRIFFQKGFSTGVDEIVSVSGVAKMTLYKHFKSKEGLLCAILEESDRAVRQLFQVVLDRPKLTPRQKLETACVGLFDAMHDTDISAGLAVRAFVEFPDRACSVHKKAFASDLMRIEWLERFCTDAHVPDCQRAAQTLLQIAKGYFLLAPTIGEEASRAIARRLVDAVCAQLEEQSRKLSGSPLGQMSPGTTTREKDEY